MNLRKQHIPDVSSMHKKLRRPKGLKKPLITGAERLHDY